MTTLHLGLARSITLLLTGVATITTTFAAQPTNSGSPTPTSMSIAVDPSTITLGETATVTATVTPTPMSDISCGKGQIQYKISRPDDLGVYAVVVNWTQLANNLTVTNNKFSAVFDSAAIMVYGNDKVTFRADYTSSGQGCSFSGQDFGHSPTTDLMIAPEPTAACPNGQITGAYISVEGPTGNGMPAPGSSGPWSFAVKVQACEELFNVSAQGGANGWALVKSNAATSGTVTVYEKKRNEVYYWDIGHMTQGQAEELTVTVDGTIKNTTGECGKVKKLNGSWSALYATEEGGVKTKSAYTTHEATIEVTCQ